MRKEHNLKRNKSIFNSSFTFRILAKIQSGFRPSQIAGHLGVTPQDIHYYTEKMVEAGLIIKDTSDGIRWRLTKKGEFILKQKATGSVNSFNNYQTKPVAKLISTRIDNISFAFKILSPIPENPRLEWAAIKNGVSKCSLKYDNHTVELVKSEKEEYSGSVMIIHLGRTYCFDWYKESINQYNLAIHYAKQASMRFAIKILDYGAPMKRPHFAFEQDPIPHFIASSHTAEIKTREGEEDEYSAWIDSSNGAGELETNDYEYGYDYLMMPKYVREIAETITIVRKQTIEYERHYHPILTRNN